MVDSEFVKLLFNNRQDTRGDHCWHIYFPLLRKFANTLDTTVEPSKSEFPPQMSRSRYFSFYFHCIKIPVNRNPSTLDKLSIISKRVQH